MGDWVLVSTKNIKLKVKQDTKLLPKFVGPVQITKCIGKVAYRVDLPHVWRIHNVFHVSLLRKHIPRGEPGNVAAPPVEWLSNDDPLYEVEGILAHHRTKTKKSVSTRFLVKWKNYDHLHNSWEPESNLVNCRELVQEYWEGTRTKTTYLLMEH